MAYLFEINGKAVYPKAETLLVSPYKEIWERDKSEGKEVALMEYGYMEFMVSMLKSNPYRDYPESKKDSIIRQDIVFIEDWNPDELVRRGMQKMVELQTEGSISYAYWMSNRKAMEKMIDFFNNFDIDERNLKSGMPIYKPKDITSAVADAEKSLATLDALKTKVEEELYEKSKTRSDKVISPFANPDSLKS